MCGRYVATTDADGLVAFFMIDDRDPQARAEHVRYQGVASYNVAPTDTVPAVMRHDGQLVLSGVRWGLVPFWAKDPKIGARMINARSETVEEKSAFAESFTRRRCLLPADGFYEWQEVGGKRLPWFVHRTDGDPMVFAGIWSSWRDPDEPERRLLTCSVLTTRTNDRLAQIHDRMPVILDRQVWDTWLDPDADAGDLRELLGPAPEEDIDLHRVTTRVGSVANNDPALVLPIDDEGGTVGPDHPALRPQAAQPAAATTAEQPSLFD